jgi:hypothetical protein
MGLRIGMGFRLSRHVWLGYTVPLGHHARRLAAHEGHFDPLGSLLGLAIMYVMLRTLWAVMWNGV